MNEHSVCKCNEKFLPCKFYKKESLGTFDGQMQF